jgi:DNA replication and repair protein RecF
MAIQLFQVRQVKLTNYKNYTFQSFDFDSKLNFIVGKNGVGKTCLLDAIYYSCFTKSYLSSSDLLVTNLKSDFFRIETTFLLNTDNQIVEIKYLKQEKKEVFVNKVKVEKQAEFIGKFPCVIITPDDNQLILGTSELRRKFIDATLSQFSSEYLSNLIVYNKILAQRNAALKSFYENRTFDKTLLEIYNQQLIKCGTMVFEYRLSFLKKFFPIFKNVYQHIFDGNENVSITYQSDLLTNDFEELIKNSENHDRNAQRTTKGIHTDDLVFELNGFPVKKIGSQGQQKTFLLSLKLAQFELLKTEKQIMPLLLLDDIFDKLDVTRIARIFRLVNEDAFGQVFISDTDEERVKSFIAENQITNYKIINLGSI